MVTCLPARRYDKWWELAWYPQAIPITICMADSLVRVRLVARRRVESALTLRQRVGLT